MRTPEQVAQAVVDRVAEKWRAGLGSPTDASVLRTSIAEEVRIFQVEFVQSVAEHINKAKGMKAKDRKAFAMELDKALGIQRG